MSTTLQNSPPTIELSAILDVPKTERLPTLSVLIGRHGRFEWTFFADHSSFSRMSVTCRNLYEEDPDWIIGASFRVTNPLDREEIFHHQFTSVKPELEWTGQVNNTTPIKITITMTLADNLKKFNFPDQFSDICLEVGTEKFHVGKWLLINQSTRFKQMFEEGDLNEPVITLPADHLLFFNDFLEFLLGEKNINDNNIYCLMKLAQHYGTPLLTRECEKFLKEDSKRTIKDIYRLGNVFQMPEVKKRAFLLIKNSKDLESFLPNDLHTFSKQEMIQLYKLSREFNHAKVSANQAAQRGRDFVQNEILRGMRERFENVVLDPAAQRRAEYLQRVEQAALFRPDDGLERFRMLIETREHELRNAPIPPGVLNEQGRARRGEFRGIPLGTLPERRGHGRPRMVHRLVWFENDDDVRAADGLLEQDVRIVVGRGEQLRMYMPPPPHGRMVLGERGDHGQGPVEEPFGPDDMDGMRMLFDIGPRRRNLMNERGARRGGPRGQGHHGPLRERNERFRIGQRIDNVRNHMDQWRNAPIPPGVLNAFGRAHREGFRGIPLGRFPTDDPEAESPLVWFENNEDAAAAAGLMEDGVAIVIGPSEDFRIQMPRRRAPGDRGEELDPVEWPALNANPQRRNEPNPEPGIMNERRARGVGILRVPYGGPQRLPEPPRNLGDILFPEDRHQNREQQPLPLFMDDRIDELARMDMLQRMLAVGARGGGHHRGMPHGGPRGRGHQRQRRPGMEPGDRIADIMFGNRHRGPPGGGDQ